MSPVPSHRTPVQETDLGSNFAKQFGSSPDVRPDRPGVSNPKEVVGPNVVYVQDTGCILGLHFRPPTKPQSSIRFSLRGYRGGILGKSSTRGHQEANGKCEAEDE